MERESGGSANSHVIRYRADIDGLRAIAVLSVIVFHLSRSALPGGYLGVDIFFVLSGYVITSIIWCEVQHQRFSIVRFYERRMRRIMPALLLVLYLTMLASVVLLLPADLMGFSKSLLATLTFAANFYFWRDIGYFLRAAEEKPLLHLWSLSVEEQFYILFPLFLVLCARWWRSGVLPMIVILTIGSLAVNMLALFIGGGSLAFYLLPTRAWEVGLGAVIALLPSYTAPRAAKASLIAVIGGLLVISSLVYPWQLFPTLPVAVPAVTGAALLILAGRYDWPMVNRALSVRPFVFVGLISFSLYLWHWPIIVLGRYYLVREFRLSEMAAALVFMMFGAIGSWYVVERPFRSQKMSIHTVRLVVGTGVIGLAVAAGALLLLQGLPWRLSAEAARINQAVGTNHRCPITDYVHVGTSLACLMHLPSRHPADADVILLGNSHAEMYAPIWATILAERGQTGLVMCFNRCLPTVQANISRKCHGIAQRSLTELKKLPRVRMVILGLTWWHEADGLVDHNGHTVNNDDNRALIAALDDVIDELHRAGKRVVLIGPIASPGSNIASRISRQIAFGHTFNHPVFFPAIDFARRFHSAIRHFEARNDIGFARPDLVQCRAERCDYLVDGRSLFADGSHIAVSELQRFRALFDAALRAE